MIEAFVLPEAHKPIVYPRDEESEDKSNYERICKPDQAP